MKQTSTRILANDRQRARGSTIGNSNTVTGNWGFAIGSGLTVSVDISTALGKWNAPMGTNDLLVVGNGSSDTNLSTALKIRNNGSVSIPGNTTLSGNTILASENASRLAAMERADKNIDEPPDALRAHFNHLRQIGIDEELFGVISAYEALSE